MKDLLQKNQLRHLMTLLFLTIVGIGGVKAEEKTVTFTAGIDSEPSVVVKDGISVGMSTMNRDDNYRCYANTDMTIFGKKGITVTKIEITCTASGTSNYGPGKFSLKEGSPGSYSYSGKIGTWEGSAPGNNRVYLTASAQVRMTKIVVTYEVAPPAYTITAQSNNTDYGTVSLSGSEITGAPNSGYRYASPAYTVTPDNSATVAQDGNTFTVTPSANTTVTINFEAIPTHSATFSINGSTLTQDYAEGSVINFPEAEAEINGKSFVGWIASSIDGETNDAPAFVTTATMGVEDVSYYAVYAIVEGEEKAATLTEEEIKNNFSNQAMAYNNDPKDYQDNEDGVIWSAKAYNTKDAPWIQIRKNSTVAYLKINANNNIKQIKITATNATVGTGESTSDITKHGDFAGDILLLSSATANASEGTLGSSNEVIDRIITITPTSNVKELYVQTTAALRIWNVEVTTDDYNYSAYCTTVLPPVELAAPIIFHDGGVYEGALKVAMAGQGTIKYTLNGGAEQTYSAPINVSETTTITAWTESNGVKSDEVSKTFTIAAATAGPAVEDNYYTIKNNGNNKYVNVAGRKTVTFVDETATAAGTVIRVKADDKGQVQILRSQGVDIPGYAEKAMNYVPKIVELIVDKLHAEGSGELLGENGLDAIMAKFKESFDYHLYLEEANGGYRIYGRTPSMQPVVDFYAENKANVDAKLPGLEAFINSAIEKVLQKTNGSGASILVPFSLQTVWEKMGSTLTEPVDEASTAKFYEEVLSSEANVWNFAYETAMIYWTKLKEHPKFQDNLDKLGDYAKYIDKVENIRPNFKYYIVQKNDQLDFISQGNSELNAAFTTWTLAERTDFSVAFNEDNLLNGKYYTTLYTDFAYTLPESVKAYKVTGIEESGCYGYAVTEEVGSQNIAAQTPVLLMSESAETQALTLSESGTAVTDNLLVGPDYLINTYKITAAQVESLFDMAKAFLGEDGYNNYLKEYEHLMLRTAGTVNNKYFYGLSKDDCKNLDENVCLLGNSEEAGIGFANDWKTMNINQAFLVSDIYTAIRLSKVGDVNRDGLITIADVPALVNIILEKVKYPDDAENYDFGAADVNCDGNITITDVTSLVNIILNQ